MKTDTLAQVVVAIVVGALSRSDAKFMSVGVVKDTASRARGGVASKMSSRLATDDPQARVALKLVKTSLANRRRVNGRPRKQALAWACSPRPNMPLAVEARPASWSGASDA
jgi:hypothetical protein